ncbi:Secretory laccase, putative isoform 1 [Hibiscus syriacus]|uniref:Laccase n=1 Tax=Hibiscus syriacus TaxID=106335 RepID=A0A6A3CEP2_HIBSY|nr:Secretory laccase, putative isoform 1 [Hibiscus syriacus]
MGLGKQGFVSVGVLFLTTLFLFCAADVHYYEFFVREANFTKLCNTTTLLAVNDSIPGPEIRVHKGDTIFVNVHNQGNYGFTIHWHGVKQPRNPWSDGPENITQCPIQPGTNFTYEVILSDEIGTLWWHAHSDWTRGSVFGPLVILPPENETYPFPEPDGEQIIMLQSWFNQDYKQIIDQALAMGTVPRQPDAYAINGYLGDTTGCPNDTMFSMQVDYGDAYLLRIINAAMNEEKFFAIANHSLTLVAQDASYVDRFTSDYIMISPGQTMDVLLIANQNVGQYYMATRPFSDSSNPPVDLITTGVLLYTNGEGTGLNASSIMLPVENDRNATNNFTSRIRNTNVTQNTPLNVPADSDINRRVYIAIGGNTLPCNTCSNPFGQIRFAASLNNVSFVFPQVDILDAYYNMSTSGVFTEDFPLSPPEFYDFTGNLSGLNTMADTGTKVVMLNYGDAVEIVLQATQTGPGGSHPIHLHGFSFYWVGTGTGNFNNQTDPSTYNLVDPPLINTVHVPGRGWVALRFFANNPGVWFMHCHFDRHASWGMDTVYIVRNGTTAGTSIRPPPFGMPRSLPIGANLRKYFRFSKVLVTFEEVRRSWLPRLGDGFIAITDACLGPVLRVEFGELPSYVVTHLIAATCGGQLDLLERSVEAVVAAS